MASMESIGAEHGAPVYAWQDNSSCIEADPDIFMPELSDPSRNIKQMRARQICASCVVRQACLDYALENSPVTGVWGGTTERERAYLLRDYTRIELRQTTGATEAA